MKRKARKKDWQDDRDHRGYDMFDNKTVIARKSINGITVGFVVGWRLIHNAGIRNIRADLVFADLETAQTFQKEMEARRKALHVRFDIVE